MNRGLSIAILLVFATSACAMGKKPTPPLAEEVEQKAQTKTTPAPGSQTPKERLDQEHRLQGAPAHPNNLPQK